MKQADFIKILDSQLPETFRTDQLLLVLLESSSPSLAQHEVRKCMHNHSYRLKQSNLVERLCPKRTRNASFKRLFHCESVNLNLLDSHSEQTDLSNLHLFKQHAQKLQEDTSTLRKKREAFSRLTNSYKMYEHLITSKLLELDSLLLDKKVELEAIHELISAIRENTNSSTYSRVDSM